MARPDISAGPPGRELSSIPLWNHVANPQLLCHRGSCVQAQRGQQHVGRRSPVLAPNTEVIFSWGKHLGPIMYFQTAPAGGGGGGGEEAARVVFVDYAVTDLNFIVGEEKKKRGRTASGNTDTLEKILRR